MTAPKGVVLTLGAIVSSPVAWLLYDGQISFDAAMIRIGICLAVVWAAVSLVSSLAYSPATMRPPVEAPSGDATPPAAPPVTPSPSE